MPVGVYVCVSDFYRYYYRIAAIPLRYDYYYDKGAREPVPALFNGAQVPTYTCSLSRSYVGIYDIAIPEKLKRDIEQTLVE